MKIIETRPDALGVTVSSLGAFEKVLRWQAQWMESHPYEKPLYLCVYPNVYRIVRNTADCSSVKRKVEPAEIATLQ